MTRSKEDELARKRKNNREWIERNPEKHRQFWHAANISRWANDPVKMYYAELKSKAKRQGMPVLTLDELRVLAASMTCAQSGLPLCWERNSPWRVSVDRVDSSKGYELGNCQVVCWLYNAAKNRFTDEDVRRLAEAICTRGK